MSIHSMAWAWDQRDLHASRKLVLLALADHADDDGKCWPGIKGVMKKCGIVFNTLQSCLKELESKGLILRLPRYNEKGTQQSNMIQLKVAPPSLPKFGGVARPKIDGGTPPKSGRGTPPKLGRATPPKIGRVYKISSLEPKLEPSIEKIFARINSLSGKKFNPKSEHQTKFLRARMKDGGTEEQCLKIVNDRWERWGMKDVMQSAFNPQTLFRVSHWETYLMEAEKDQDIEKERENSIFWQRAKKGEKKDGKRSIR